MKKILTACLMAVLCQSASADNGRWWQVGSGAYMDILRTNRNNVWIKFDNNDKNYPYKYKISQYLLDCKTNSLALVQNLYYDKTDKVIWHDHLKSYEIQYKQVAPNSIGETIWALTCISPQEAEAFFDINNSFTNY